VTGSFTDVVVLLGILGLLIHLIRHIDEVTVDRLEDGLQRVEREMGARFPGRRPRSGAESAYGTVGDATLAVTIDRASIDRAGSFDELVVVLEGPRVPRGISFAKEGGGDEDILTGDPVFDDMVEVHGEPSLVLALLGKDLRPAVADFVDKGGSLRSGRFRCHARLELSEDQIPDLVRMTLGLAEALTSAEKGGICPRLARNAADDPLPEVRRLNLLELHNKFTATREALATSRAALADTSPWVRLAAARFLRAEVETLEALVRDGQVPDEAAAEAVTLLAARLAPERAGPLLMDVLTSHTGNAQRQAIEALGALRHRPALGPLIVVLQQGDPRTAASAALALGALGDPDAETGLLAVLGRTDADLRLAAARALGHLGTVASVAPLLALQESRGLDTAARRAIGGAIARIQSRLVGAGAGQLTVASAESESGRLSLAGSETGALTLAQDPEVGSKRLRDESE
jgi:HEAT repeat protein